MMRVEYIDITTHQVGREQAIRLYVNDNLIAVTQGTPDNLDELAIGYLVAEGCVTRKADIVSIDVDPLLKQVHVVLAPACMTTDNVQYRVSSASVVPQVIKPFVPYQAGDKPLDDFRIKANDIACHMQELLLASPKRNDGECVHGAGLGGRREQGLLVVREDIGRHNALDKVVGWAWLNDVSLIDKALFITGRISAEMVIKTYQSGARILVSHKSPTEEALWRAQEMGVTLVARCREESMQVFTHAYRICAE